MSNKEPKQVLVWRADLRNTNGQKVRTGKICAQLAHASMKAVLDIGYNTATYVYMIPLPPVLNEWLSGRFTKICVSVDSEQELLDIYNQAKNAGLICSLIQDAGLTEFGGTPTYTCCAIGPAYPEQLDNITGHLKLL